MRKIVISGGGTAGHINPALSIAYYLKKFDWEIHYIGNKSSLEERLVNTAGYPFHPINIQKLYRRFTFAHLKFPFKLISSIIRTYIIMKKLQPCLFLGTGGFVSGPAGFSAHLLKIPIFLQEQNSFPGITTRLLAKWSENIFLGNINAKKYLPARNTQYTGNPIQPGIFNNNLTQNFRDYGLTEEKTKIFLLGGSQGSFVLNSNFALIVDKILKSGLEIIWQTGKYSFAEFQQQFGDKKGVYVFDYTDNIAALYGISKLVIARAGALTLAELETLKIPALLIPLPSAAANHQFYNAQELAEKGVAEIIEQKDLTPALLLEKIIMMIKNIELYRKKFEDTPHRGSAAKIAETINNIFGG